ncbi:ComGF family competence protein [Oceanobacillus picturae]|uniref:ComGF family competence protein n=1 Tax=Oceanobacillus picturae TaxID=171693 RepID=UPI0009DDD2E2|nr:ComGF family competence protein [Oceanobacillus picturae]
MLKKKEKQSVYMVFLEKSSGFTMIQSLLAISFLALSLPFLASLLKAADIPLHEQELSIQQFFTFLQDDVKNATSFKLKDAGKILELNLVGGSTTTLEKYGNLIRRRVNGTGHEVYLRNIASLRFEPAAYGFSIFVTMEDGETFEKTIIWYDEE